MSHVPTYVYVLFIILLYLGYKRCFSRTIKLSRLAILPLLFIFLSLRSMFTLFSINIASYLYFGSGILIGIIFGWLHVKSKPIAADHKQQLITVPGDWTMLLLILCIFFSEFFIHYAIEAHWDMTQSPFFDVICIAILGVITGMTLGRNLTYFYKFIRAPNKALNIDVLVK